MTTGAVVEGDDPGPLVCSCFAVGRNTILRAIEANGFTETHQVVSCLRAGGNCGSCLPEIKGLLGRTLSDTRHEPLQERSQQQHQAAADGAPPEDLQEQRRQGFEVAGVIIS